MAYRFVAKNLRSQLIALGVLVPRQTGRIAYTKTLNLLLNQDEFNTNWTEDDRDKKAKLLQQA
jgi:hypothetical protein